MSKSSEKESKGTLYELTHGKAVYIISFIVPLIIMIAIFYMRDMYPFGDKCYLRSDMYHQYCPFFSELWHKLRTGGSLFYSWDIGMGTNFLAVYGYYLSSPSNWFIAIFPQKNMIEIMNVIILLKLSLSSLSCTYYLCQHTRRRHISAAIFGMFYSLSAFIAAYSWNLMWLDCVLLLPLVVLGLEKLIYEGKGLLYVCTLGLTILSNYYIAIMVCASMVILYFAITIAKPVPKDPTDYIKGFGRFALYSLIAGAFAAIILLPEICALKATASGSFNFPKKLERYFSFITIMERQLMNVEVHTGLEHLPNIYCGVAVFLLFPMYILNKKVSAREKITKVVALVIFFTAFNLNIPNFIWHGFHYPNSLPCRQSFIYIFILLSMCYDAFNTIEETKSSKLTGAFWGVLALLLYIGNNLTDNKQVDFKILYASAIFIAVYALMYFIIIKRPKLKDAMVILLLAISIVECTINMNVTGYSPTTRSYYLRDYDAVQTLMNNVKMNKDSSDLYRTTKFRGYRSKNDASWHNFHGGSVFSSTAYAALTKLYGNLGLEHSTNAYSLNGATPLIYSMFGVKYLISNAEITGKEVYSFVDAADGEFLYQNNYSLPIAYMVPSAFDTLWLPDENSNPFVIQNELAEYAANVKNLFTRITFEDYDTSADIIADKDCYLYLYIMNKSISSASVSIDGDTQTYTGINHGRMIDVGFIKEGTTVHVTDDKNSNNELQMYAYIMNAEKLQQVYNALVDESLNVTYYNDTHINGTITCKNDGLMLTTIPYDASYTLYVDGVKTAYTSSANGAFISVPLTKGEHQIQFSYVPRGFKAGLALTIISIILLGGCIAFRIIYKKEITEDGAITAALSTFKKAKVNAIKDSADTADNSNSEERND